MSVVVREARPGDAVAIRDVHLAAIEGLADSAYTAQQVAAWAHDRDPGEYPIAADDTHFVVAERDGDVLGFGYMEVEAGAYFDASVDGEITAVYVRPSAARRGIGTDIYTALETAARRRGIETLGLWASLNAVPFYEALGYQRIARHTVEYTDGVELPVIEMTKPLPE